MRKTIIFFSIILSLVCQIASLKAFGLENAHPTGTLINDRGTIYLIQNRERHGFRNPQEFFSYGYNFDMVLPANESDLSLPAAPALRARDGTLALDLIDNQTLYFIFEGTLRQVDKETLYLLGIENYPQIKLDLADYPKKQPLTLLETFKAGQPGTLVIDRKTIYLVMAFGLAPFSTPEVYQSYGYIFGMARNLNSEEAKLPILDPLPYRDGTLVNENGTIYLISQKNKYGFKTLQGFLSRGYKLKTVIKGNTTGYPVAENFE